MFDKFLSPEAVFSVRKHVTDSMCDMLHESLLESSRERSELNRSIFDPAVSVVRESLESGAYRFFLQSEQYQSMVNSLGDAQLHTCIPLEDILSYRRFASFFLVHLIKEQKHPPLAFWMDVEFDLKLKQQEIMIHMRASMELSENDQDDYSERDSQPEIFHDSTILFQLLKEFVTKATIIYRKYLQPDALAEVMVVDSHTKQQVCLHLATLLQGLETEEATQTNVEQAETKDEEQMNTTKEYYSMTLNKLAQLTTEIEFWLEEGQKKIQAVLHDLYVSFLGSDAYELLMDDMNFWKQSSLCHLRPSSLSRILRILSNAKGTRAHFQPNDTIQSNDSFKQKIIHELNGNEQIGLGREKSIHIIESVVEFALTRKTVSLQVWHFFFFFFGTGEKKARK